MFNLKIKPKKLVLVVVGVLGFGLFVKLAFFPTKSVPFEFAEARLKGSAVAQSILVLSHDSLKSLEEISQYDRQGNTAEALILISRELIKNRETHNAAIRLSTELEKMAQNIPDIQPSSARQLATEAVTSEVALVRRLLSYNNYLTQLFEVLRQKFSKPYSNTSGRVAELISKINEEAQAINDLDKHFNNAILEFDKIFAK